MIEFYVAWYTLTIIEISFCIIFLYLQNHGYYVFILVDQIWKNMLHIRTILCFLLYFEA